VIFSHPLLPHQGHELHRAKRLIKVFYIQPSTFQANSFIRPSVILDLAYFTINQRSLKGTQWEWEAPPKSASANGGINGGGAGGSGSGNNGTAAAGGAASAADVQEMARGIMSLEKSLDSIINEQHYLRHR
jgi:hypothetical protein